MTVNEIKAYAEAMIEACEKGGTLTPNERIGVVTTVIAACGRPYDESQSAKALEAGCGPSGSWRGSVPTL